MTTQPGLSSPTSPSTALVAVAEHLSVDSMRAEPIALGENEIWRLPGSVIARIARTGQEAAASKEAHVARWLAALDVPAVRLYPGLEQPVTCAGHPVTFWEELPPHGSSTLPDLATALRSVHALPLPDFLEPVQPFVRLQQRLDSANQISDDDRQWLSVRLTELEEAWHQLPPGRPDTVIHGDAHTDNIVTTTDGVTLLLDLERFAIGPPEWDLLLTATHYASCGWETEEDYQRFCTVYGGDVRDSARYEYLRDIRELRITLFAAQLANDHPGLQSQAAHRIECLRGLHGPRPWPGWQQVPF